MVESVIYSVGERFQCDESGGKVSISGILSFSALISLSKAS